MSKLTFFAAAVACAATAFQLHAVTPEAALNAAIVPDADIQAYSNDAKISATPIAKQMEALGLKIQDLVSKNTDADSKKIAAFQEFCKKEGFASENMEASMFSVAFDKFVTKAANNAKNNSDAKISFDDLNVVGAFAMKKAVSKDAIKKIINEGIKTFADDDDDLKKRIAITDFAHGNASGVTIAIKPDEDDLEYMPFEKLPVFSFALLADNKVLFAGFDADVKAAIDRANAGKKADASAALKKLLDSNLAGSALSKRDAYAAIVVPQVFRDWVAEMEQMFGAGAPPGFLPGIKAAKALQGVRIASAYGDKFDGTFNLVLDTAENAAALKDLLQIQVLNMAKMGIFQFAGKNTGFAESLVATADGASTSISFTITADDLNFFFDAFKKKLEEPAFAPFFIEEFDFEDDDE